MAKILPWPRKKGRSYEGWEPQSNLVVTLTRHSPTLSTTTTVTKKKDLERLCSSQILMAKCDEKYLGKCS